MDDRHVLLFEEITRRLSDLNLNRTVGILNGITNFVVASFVGLLGLFNYDIDTPAVGVLLRITIVIENSSLMIHRIRLCRGNTTEKYEK